MNEGNQINYYAIIPATVRYDNELKSAEKLLYGEITALANKFGYCYAKNRYFADLYNVTIETVSRWVSHLQAKGYIEIEIIRNEKKEVITRYIYIMDVPYLQKNQYPYCQKNQQGIHKKVKDNNININKDDLYYFIINNSNKIPQEFYKILKRLELIYTEEILSIMQKDKIEIIKNIVYVLYDLYLNDYKQILLIVNRETLINLYMTCSKHYPDNFFNYYKQSIVNKYTNNTT